MRDDFKNKLKEIKKDLFKARSKIEELNVTDPQPSRAEMKANAAKLPPKKKEEFPDSLLEPWIDLCNKPGEIFGAWWAKLPRRWKIFTFVPFYPIYMVFFLVMIFGSIFIGIGIAIKNVLQWILK